MYEYDGEVTTHHKKRGKILTDQAQKLGSSYRIAQQLGRAYRSQKTRLYKTKRLCWVNEHPTGNERANWDAAGGPVIRTTWTVMTCKR
jgi:hypothetical protein